MLALGGRFEEGIESGRLAVDLDPYSPLAHVMYSYSLTWARRFDAAVRAGEEAIRLRPDAVFPYLALSLAHLSGGRFENAVAVCEKAVELTHRSHGYTNSQLGTAYAYAGRTHEALRVLEELRERSQREYVPPYCFARIYAALGDLDAAFAAFEQAIEQRNTLLWALDCYDELAHLRTDPRFPALVARVRAMTA